MIKVKSLIALALFAISFPLLAQLKQKPVWQIAVNKNQVKVGDEVELIFTTNIDKDWYMYSSDFSENVGPVVARFEFEKNNTYTLVGKIKPIGSHKHFDDVFEGEVSTFEKKAEFRQKVKILKSNPVIKASAEYQQCSQITGQCILYENDFDFTGKIKVEESAKNAHSSKVEETSTNVLNQTDSENVVNETSIKNETSNEKVAVSDVAGGSAESIWGFLFFAFTFGLIAVVTPCVFPMLPMTVTFFTKRSETRSLALKRAFGFGFSIIAIYSSLGVVFSIFGLGPDFGNWLSTHWVPNVLFFIIFIVFAASFLGMFEITLPHSVVNKVDKQSNMGSFMGVFFMGFTLVLVSFSCTGPIVGSLLIEAVGGQILKPILGMAAFGFGLALPFTLFAIFPNWMQNLPKSGGWLNSVKVVLGFLELALAFKFLSIPDQTYHWGLLDREVYIAIWIVIFTLMGFYLLGKLKFSHDSDLPYISVPRLFLAIITFSFVLYLVPGLWGAPLKALSGYLPPQETLDFDLSKGKAVSVEPKTELGDVRFKELFKLPHEIDGFFDYKQALAYSKKLNKPVFIDFTGHGCVNCREMEANVWSNPEVLKRLKNDFVVVALYVDDKTELPENEWYTSTYDNKIKKSIGKQNADLQITKYNANAQPYYCIVDGEGKLLVQPKAYDLNIQNFINFLDSGIEAFKIN
ncbi:MAG: cytochrome c biogenesis protein CcdA [Bacteroidia bacterium]